MKRQPVEIIIILRSIFITKPMSMKTSGPLYLLAFSLILSFSCTKEKSLETDNPPPANKLIGSYDFAGMTAATKSTTEAAATNDKTIAISYYNTKDNKGTVIIDAGKFNVNGMAYTIDTAMIVEAYEDGVQILSDTMPFKVVLPSLNSSAPYKLINADSVYFEKGFISAPDGSSTTSTVASGSRISWSGDTLFILTKLLTTSTETSGGELITNTSEATQLVKLRKK